MSLLRAIQNDSRPELRLGMAYACYLAALSLALTWWPLHFSSLGMTGAQIGMIFSVRVAISTLTQPMVTAFTDRIGRPILMLRVIFVWAMFWPGLLLFAEDVRMIAVALCMSGLMTSALAPILDASIVREVGAQRFGDIRLWGSVGYGVTVLVYGLLMLGAPESRSGYGAIVGWVLFLALGALVMFGTPRAKEVAALSRRAPSSGGFGWVRAPFLVLLGFNALHWGSIQAFNLFISLHITERGFSSAVLGLAVGAAIAGEIVGFIWAKRLLTPARAHEVLPWIYLAGALRWIVTGFTTSPWLLVAVQLVHFLSYGLWMASLIHLISRYVPEERRASAQGLMAALTLGVGGMCAHMVSGWLFDLRGGEMVFVVAAFAEALACLIMLMTWHWWSRPPRPVSAV